MPFAATWMNLEDIMLSEISRHRKLNTARSHLYVESKRVELLKAESRMMVAKGRGVRDIR